MTVNRKKKGGNNQEADHSDQLHPTGRKDVKKWEGLKDIKCSALVGSVTLLALRFGMQLEKRMRWKNFRSYASVGSISVREQ